jgi:hypothetical protein
LRVNGFVERAAAIQLDAHEPAGFPIDILLAADAFDKLCVVAGFSGRNRQQQGTLEA